MKVDEQHHSDDVKNPMKSHTQDTQDTDDDTSTYCLYSPSPPLLHHPPPHRPLLLVPPWHSQGGYQH